MLAGADAIGEPSEQRRRRAAIELERLVRADALTRPDFRRDLIDHRHLRQA
jgi:hypothetical protein